LRDSALPVSSPERFDPLADELVVLERGRIAARGVHDELIGTSPVYREIYEHGLLEHELIEQVEAAAS
jgi:ABC-type molybdate transport system ATPase subunit